MDEWISDRRREESRVKNAYSRRGTIKPTQRVSQCVDEVLCFTAMLMKLALPRRLGSHLPPAHCGSISSNPVFQ